MKGIRTGVEFENHELTVVDEDFLHFHELKKPDTLQGRIKFIHMEGMLIVVGDYGNWMFYRDFYPGPKEYVSDGYWIEKLEMHSTQKGTEFSSEATYEALLNGINGGLEEHGYYGDELEMAIRYYERCIEYCDSEWEYVAFAHGDNKPGFIDHEDVPYVTRTKQWLRVVFDAFDEICRRMKENEQINN
jgi:hypothetical protein